MTKRAFITGILGQDGAYLAKFLLGKGYEVIGGYRRSSTLNTWRLRELGIEGEVSLIPFDLLEFTNIVRAIEKLRPDEFYNLAAQSFVGMSFDQPVLTSEICALGPAKILDALRTVNPECHFYQASTSEMFGKAVDTPQTELTPFYPRSPYGVSKLYAHWMTVNYREAFNLYACSGILFNHESPLRGIEFVTRKITAHLAQIRHGLRDALALGNLAAQRDWGFAGDYVKGMWLMLQRPQPGDYVIASGKCHSVREFVDLAADASGFRLDWQGEAEQTKAIDRNTGRVIVHVDPEFYRAAEVDRLRGDPSRARRELGWKPEVSFDALVEMMVRSDMDRAARMTA